MHESYIFFMGHNTGNSSSKLGVLFRGKEYRPKDTANAVKIGCRLDSSAFSTVWKGIPGFCKKNYLYTIKSILYESGPVHGVSYPPSHS